MHFTWLYLDVKKVANNKMSTLAQLLKLTLNSNNSLNIEQVFTLQNISR